MAHEDYLWVGVTGLDGLSVGVAGPCVALADGAPVGVADPAWDGARVAADVTEDFVLVPATALDAGAGCAGVDTTPTGTPNP